MKKLIGILLCIFTAQIVLAQRPTIYHPEENADSMINIAVKKAEKEGKHVFLAVGGNWCSWCITFDKLTKEDSSIRNFIEKNYVIYHVNYSKENENQPVLRRLGFPQRFGFPVFVILDGKGNRLHTQNSEYLEDGGKGYKPVKVLSFLESWSPVAVDPKSYGFKK